MHSLETISEQLIQDGEGTVYAFRAMGRVRFQLEFGELLEVSGILFVLGLRDSKLSIPTLEGAGYAVVFKSEHIFI